MSTRWHASSKQGVSPVVGSSVSVSEAEREDKGGASKHRLKAPCLLERLFLHVGYI